MASLPAGPCICRPNRSARPHHVWCRLRVYLSIELGRKVGVQAAAAAMAAVAAAAAATTAEGAEKDDWAGAAGAAACKADGTGRCVLAKAKAVLGATDAAKLTDGAAACKADVAGGADGAGG